MSIRGKNRSMLRDREKGFTLIEIAMVLVIIGLLVGIGAGLMGPLTKQVKLRRTRDTVNDVYNAIIGYAASNKIIPPDLQVLGVKTKDAYGRDLLYSAAGGITAGNICTTMGGYLKVNDEGTSKENVAFIVFSQGENVCNDTGTSSPFTITMSFPILSSPVIICAKPPSSESKITLSYRYSSMSKVPGIVLFGRTVRSKLTVPSMLPSLSNAVTFTVFQK